MKIYVATSWKNKHTDEVIRFLKELGHEPYDFRAEGFSWRDAGIAGDREHPAGRIADLLEVPLAREGFAKDMRALSDAEAVVLVLPAGRSAHLEAGWAAGQGKTVVVYQPELERPDLMHSMARAVVGTLEDVALELATAPQAARDPAAELEACYRHLETGAAHPLVAESFRRQPLLVWLKVAAQNLRDLEAELAKARAGA